MIKIQCICGEELYDVACPSPNKAWLLRDFDICDAKNWNAGDIIENSREVWECQKCGRVAIGNCINTSLKWYKPEDNIPGNLTQF